MISLFGMRLVTGGAAAFVFSTIEACLLTTSLDGLAGSSVDAGPGATRDSGRREAAADGAPSGDAEPDGNPGSCLADGSACGPS